MKILSLATVIASTMLLASVAEAAVLYQEPFSGAAVNINGVPVAGGALAPANWSANATYRADGSVDGNVEGSAILPFNPIANAIYTLSLDVANTTDRWVALGFARDPLTGPGVDTLNDRFANETEGIAWMLYRDHASDPTQDIQLFAGLRTGGGIVDNNAAVNFNQVNTLQIVLDTTGAGSSFTADFFLNGVSISSGPQNIAINIDDVNFVGISFDDATTNQAIRVDNFLLTGPVPEPASIALASVALVGASAVLRRRKA